MFEDKIPALPKKRKTADEMLDEWMPEDEKGPITRGIANENGDWYPGQSYEPLGVDYEDNSDWDDAILLGDED